jgi:hypothetical protein
MKVLTSKTSVLVSTNTDEAFDKKNKNFLMKVLIELEKIARTSIPNDLLIM